MNIKQSFSNWKNSSVTNKVGTIFWAISTVLMMFAMILAPAADIDGYSSACFATAFPFFLINLVITFFLFLDVDIVKVIAKNFGYYLILCIVLVIFTLCVVLSILSNVIEPLAAVADAIGPKAFFDVLGEAAGESFFALFPFLAIVISAVLVIVGAFLISSSDRPKNRVCSLVMLILFGLLGGHLSYVKRTGAAVVRIILTVTIILMPVSELLCLIDFILILAGKFKDKQKNLITAWV